LRDKGAIDAKRVQNIERLAELDRRFASFKFDQKSQPDAGCGGQISLPQFEGAASCFHSRGDI
jgi:hypothetical protein